MRTSATTARPGIPDFAEAVRNRAAPRRQGLWRRARTAFRKGRCGVCCRPRDCRQVRPGLVRRGPRESLLMDFFTMVRPEHLNHYGSLFGGQMLKWVDEYAYLAAVRDFPCARLVTRAMDHVSFTRGVRSGAILRFSVHRAGVGNTSVRYAVQVHARDCGTVDEYPVFDTVVTFVAVEADGRKASLPAPVTAP